MDNVVLVRKVNKTFGKGRKRQQVLHNLSFHVLQNEIFGFLGPNGAGKSTTIKLLLNFLRPESGTLSILKYQVGRDEFRHRIGYLPEAPFFYEHLTARETLLLSGRLSNLSADTLAKRIPMLLSRMELHEAADRQIRVFSKGMKQRLGVANALIHDPEVLIFDEPMSGLDPLGRHLVKDIILELKQQGKTIFFSSHILSDIEELCDKIGVIHKGRGLFFGKQADFTEKGKSLEECFIQKIREADHATSS